MATFNETVRRHDKVVGKTPVGRLALHNSLTRLKQTGVEAMDNGQVTAKELAERMVTIYSKIGDLTIKPPLTAEQQQAIDHDLQAYRSIIEGPDGSNPTDTGSIPTGEGKGL